MRLTRQGHKAKRFALVLPPTCHSSVPTGPQHIHTRSSENPRMGMQLEYFTSPSVAKKDQRLRPEHPYFRSLSGKNSYWAPHDTS
jgi:hypothetical protein